MKSFLGISNFVERSLVFPILSHILAFWERKKCFIEQRNVRYCWRWLKLFHAYVFGICVGVSVWGMQNNKAREFWSDISIKDPIRGTTQDNTERWSENQVQFISVAQSCPTLCDPMNRSTPGFPVHHHLPEFTQTHVQWVRDAIQPSHPRSSPSPPAPNPSQHQSLFQWVNSSHEVAKVLELQL